MVVGVHGTVHNEGCNLHEIIRVGYHLFFFAFQEIALTTQAPTDVHVTLDTQEKVARSTLMNARHRLVDMVC